jgi:ABC-type transport system involved in multi-copper enzyme maturation permease subunit
MFCLFVVLFRHRIQADGSPILPLLRARDYNQYIYNVIYSGTLKGIFALLTIFLGLGGMLRERRHRTAIFTLALPVSRLQLVATQMGVGLSELAILSLLPALLIPSLSLLVHQSYPLAQALHFSFLWFACGSIIFAAAFLLSVVLDGEYTAPLVCYVVLMLQSLTGNWPALRPYRLNLMWTMGEVGRVHWDSQHNFLISDPLLWARLLIIMLTALVMLASAARITERQDF